MMSNIIQNNISNLSPKLQIELYRYLELLINQKNNNQKTKIKFNFNWEDALSNLKDKYNSVDLQHKALEWR